MSAWAKANDPDTPINRPVAGLRTSDMGATLQSRARAAPNDGVGETDEKRFEFITRKVGLIGRFGNTVKSVFIANWGGR